LRMDAVNLFYGIDAEEKHLVRSWVLVYNQTGRSGEQLWM
jgi:hypothetical protein